MIFLEHFVSSIVSLENPVNTCNIDESYCLKKAIEFYSNLGYFVVSKARMIGNDKRNHYWRTFSSVETRIGIRIGMTPR